MAGRKLLKESPGAQLFPEALERDPLQLQLDPTARARAKAAEEAREVRRRMMQAPGDLFSKK